MDTVPSQCFAFVCSCFFFLSELLLFYFYLFVVLFGTHAQTTVQFSDVCSEWDVKKVI